MQHRQPLDHRVDVGVRPAGELRGQRVRGQVGRAHGDAQLRADAPRHAQHLALVLQVQAVAGLDLQRRRAVGDQGARTGDGLCEQVVLAGLAHRAHAGNDPPAGAGDLLVAGALQAHLELARAVTGEHQVGMAVDQPRGDPAGGLGHLAGQLRGRTRQVGTGTDPRQRVAAPGERTVIDRTVAILVEGGDRGTQHKAIPALHLRARVGHPEAPGALPVHVAGHCRRRVLATSGPAGENPSHDDDPQRQDLAPGRLAPRHQVPARPPRPNRAGPQRREHQPAGRARHRQPALARIPAGDGRHGRAPGACTGLVLELARGDVPLRPAAGPGQPACGRGPALRGDAGGRLHHGVRVPLPAPRAGRPAV